MLRNAIAELFRNRDIREVWSIGTFGAKNDPKPSLTSRHSGQAIRRRQGLEEYIRLTNPIWWTPQDFAQLGGIAKAKKLSDGGDVAPRRSNGDDSEPRNPRTD